MINRHFLRAKVLQALYGYYLSASDDVEQVEKRLFQSINNLYYLEVCFFAIIIELKDIEAAALEESKGKFLPTKKDLDPNMRLINNRFIAQLEKNTELKKAIEKRKVNWSEYFVLLRNMLSDIKETELYRKYMIAKNVDYNYDKKFVLKLFKEHIAGNQHLQEVLFENEMEWEADYWYVLEFFLKFLKEFKEEDDETKPLLHPLDKHSDDEQSDEQYVISLLKNTIAKYDEFDVMIDKRVENWDRKRLAIIDVLILKMGMAELVFCRTIPIRVTLNEYIELAKEFSTERSSLFVNGMLDRLIVDLRSQGLIQKEGRGMETLDGYN
ncbi:MAG: transcription antitermination factor NusB [Bacteroidales bacterium]|jgi:N utilization substance protein B|nr:transcription antitermination factor NusB [Bacteroidales bacterium]